MTFSSIPFVISYFQNGSDLSKFDMINSPLAVTVSAYFISYLIADMLLGYYCYPDQMDPVTGWAHHTIYLFLIPLIIHYKVPGAFLVAAVMELPTLILAVGYLNPLLRSENLFGLTFFITRLMFHVYFAYYLRLSWPDKYAFQVISTITMPLHIHWFSKWVKRQIKLGKRYQDIKETPSELVIVDDYREEKAKSKPRRRRTSRPL
ncbi:hypothetical protein HDV06_006087 [Boothiomyces sp. JEL0866]|nr:hypothetical protein HDV06_006037 [Boothiomyces sp. JEL0866]KAJ3324829.1 hypothetical protein HDV06_006087 [Boothiomyces sp. JEL0866]